MKIARFFSKTIIFCGIIFFSLLSIFTTIFTVAQNEDYNGSFEVYFAPTVIIGIIAVIVVFSIKPIQDLLLKINTHIFARFVFFWGLIVSLLWIFIANVLPMWDSMDLVSAANALNGTPDDFSGSYWADGWYLERYPYQIPIVLLITVCMKIAGSNFIILFEVINCFACALTMYLIVKLTHELFRKKEVTIMSGLLAMFFIPIVLYCTFIYGNIICLPLILAGFFFQKHSMDASSTRSAVLFAILSAVCLALGAFFKSSMLIFIIAAIVIWIIWAIKQKHYKYLIFAVFPFLLLKCLSFATNTFVSAETGTDLNNGVPKIAWINMGIGGGQEYKADQEGNPSFKNSLVDPGYYDGFAWVTSAEEYSPELVSEISQKYLIKRIQHFASDPGFMFSFFSKKLLIEWTEPTFEGFLASNWRATSPITGYNMSERDYTALAPSIYYGKAHSVLFYIMDVMQSILAIGSLIALIVYRKKFKIFQLIPTVCVLGGAALYLLWENKTQYMFPFYLFMIPLASLGFIYLTTTALPKFYAKLKKQNLIFK